jgi:hypothetical protein
LYDEFGIWEVPVLHLRFLETEYCPQVELADSGSPEVELRD